MKKVLVLMMAAVILLPVFSGCKCGKDKETETESTPESTESETPSETETEPPETETKTEPPETTSEVRETGTTTSRVNFRTGPGTEYESYGVLESGVEVEVLGEENGWCRVFYDGREGCISREYLRLPGDPEPQTAGPEVPYDPNGGVLADSGRFPDVQSLSNNSIPYGCDWESKDETGLPNGVHYYESLYGQYGGVYRIKTGEKLIYLTFDEGYELGYTPLILDTLKEKNVKAVFFITKQFYDNSPDLIQRMIDEGHIVGNHTCRHPSGGYPKYVDENGMDSFIEDISTLHKLVYDSFGYSMRLFRFPEGESSERLMAQLVNFGYAPVFWSYAHRDYVTDDQPEISVTLDRCLSHMAPGSIYLLHAVSSSNTAALGEFIDQARAQGYDFAQIPVDDVMLH
ncbi:MAG: polysaccharide deacetylase family protein [Lachnospiraceae bacterium]|nr:polysaccharide deacetylase family protein [Lachnospiraceae bacterium]